MNKSVLPYVCIQPFPEDAETLEGTGSSQDFTDTMHLFLSQHKERPSDSERQYHTDAFHPFQA